MMGLATRDERERAIDGEAERLVATILSFGILVLVMIRSARGEAAWDLLALVVGAGLAGMAWRVRRRAVDRRLALALAGAAGLAAIAAAVLVALVAR